MTPSDHRSLRVLPFSEERLWSQVLGSAKESLRTAAAAVRKMPRETEVNQLDVPIHCNSEVIGLDVAVNDGQIVKRLQAKSCAANVEAGSRRCQGSLTIEKEVQIATWQVLEPQENLVVPTWKPTI